MLVEIERSLFEIIVQIASSKVFKHYEKEHIVLVLVEQPHDVWVLGHFQRLNFFSLQLELVLRHVVLFSCLDGDMGLRLLTLSFIDYAILPTSQLLQELVIVETTPSA